MRISVIVRNLSKTLTQYKSLHLAAILVTTLALAPFGTSALAQTLCTPNEQNIIELNARYAPKIRPQIQSSFQALADELKLLGTEVSRLEKMAISQTNINPATLQSSAARALTQTVSLKTKLEAAVSRLKPLENELGRLSLSAYFKIASSLVNVLTMAQPKSISIEKMQNQLGVRISAQARNSIFPTQNEMPQGLELATLSSNPVSYRLTLASQNAFESMVRAVGTSRSMEKYSLAYLETARCTLARTIFAKLHVYKSVLGADSFQIPIADNIRVCSNTSAGEISKMVSREADEAGELLIREQIAARLPNPLREITPATAQALTTDENLAASLLTLFAYPELLPLYSPATSSQVLSTVTKDLERALEVSIKKHPQFQDLKGLWRSKALAPLARKIYSNLEGCRYAALDELLQPLSLEEMLAKFSRSENLIFASMLESEIAMAGLGFSRQTPERLAPVLKSYIIDIKIRSLKEAVIAFLIRSSDQFSLDAYQFVAALDNEIEATARQEIEMRLKSSQLNSYVTQVTREVLGSGAGQKRTSAKSLLMSKTMHEKAVEVERIMNPRTPVARLGFNRPALVRLFSNDIQSLSQQNRMRFEFALNEESPNLKLKIWNDLNAKLRADVRKHGVQCKADSKIKVLFNTAREYLGLSGTPSEGQKAQRDCELATRLGGYLALNKTKDPQNIAHVITSLQRLVDKKDVETFISSYREEVAADILAEHRLLDAPINEKQKNSEVLYERLARDAQGQSSVSDQLAIKNLPLIRSLLVRSVPTLISQLKTVLSAKKPEDLEFFITRTKVINAILGEEESGANNGEYLESFSFSNTLSDNSEKETFNSTQLITGQGLHFPELLKVHHRLQNKMILREENNYATWNEFLSFQGQIAMTVVGGWAAKWALGYMPKYTGGPLVSSALQRAGARTSRLISGHGWMIMPLFLGSIGTFEMQKRGFQSELANINDLMRSDALTLGTPSTSLPMIEWSDYRRQKALFTSTIQQLKTAQIQTAGFLAASTALSFAPRLLNFSRPMEILNKKILASHTQGGKISKAFETNLRFQIWALKNQQSGNLRILGNPKTIDIATLQAARDAALARAGSGLAGRLRTSRINEAYENIIGNIGSRVWQYQSQPHMNKAMNRILFGDRADESQITRWYQEYNRLFGGVR